MPVPAAGSLSKHQSTRDDDTHIHTIQQPSNTIANHRLTPCITGGCGSRSLLDGADCEAGIHLTNFLPDKRSVGIVSIPATQRLIIIALRTCVYAAAAAGALYAAALHHGKDRRQ